MPSTLSSLQERILDVLARRTSGWTLTGGAALAGFHLGHRRTDDLDLFFHGRRAFDHEPASVAEALRAEGLEVETLSTAPGFVRLVVDQDADRVVVDLVAEPVPVVESPMSVRPGLQIDTPHEILVNKLCALVSRAELRDLEDVRALVERGEDLGRALQDAPRKDGGFSPMTLAWLLQQVELRRAEELGFDEERLRAFRDELLARIGADDAR